MPALDRIEVKGFKSIRQLDIELRSLNVLIGANGSGKSNFINLFRFFNALVEKRLQDYVAQQGGASNLLYYGVGQMDSMSVFLHFENYRYEVELIRTSEDRFIFTKEFAQKTDLPGKHGDSIDAGQGHHESRILVLLEKDALFEDFVKAFQSWKLYHFHDTSDFARVKLTQDIHDNRFLRPDASNLAAYLYYLRERQHFSYERIIKTVRLVAPFFDDFVLEPNRLNPETILLRWRERGVERDLSAVLLSDGTLRFICLATLLQQPEDDLPSTLIIDEPELGLHPSAISLLASMIRSASVQTQIIISTQASRLVDEFEAESIFVIERENGQSVIKQLNLHDLETWLEDYSLGELWEMNVLGGHPTNWQLQR
ncbi:MAG: AAA family ATPase [bacterium]|nr:AAA family ATPase [bacterium]